MSLTTMPRLAITLLVLSSLLLQAQTTSPANSVQVTDLQVTYSFGQQATFQASLQNPDGISLQRVVLFYQSQGKSIQVQQLNWPDNGRLTYELNLANGALRPFASVSYWFQVQPEKGPAYKSPVSTFTYEDNRFTWQTLKEGLFNIHWIDGDLVFGQAVYNAAEAGLVSTQNLLQLPQPAGPVDIYVYSHARDLQTALELGGQEWVAGHASPDLGIVLVSIAPGPEQRLQMEKQVPHELNHILLYQKLGSSYNRQPAWLVEGLASQAEVYRSSDYSVALDSARNNQSLLPITSLCTTFPKDASNAFLAYAEADSFTHFLLTNYGTSGLMRLIGQYSDALGCSEGFSAAFKIPLERIEYRWKQEVLGIDIGLTAVIKLLPYLAILAVLLVFPALPGLLSRRKPAFPSANTR